MDPQSKPAPEDREALSQLADFIDGQHAAILSDWRQAVRKDPALRIASRLNRREFEDNITASLQLLSVRLRQGRPFIDSGYADDVPEADPVDLEASEHAHEHGLHRWQVGYDVRNLTREWGHLHICLLQLFNRYEAEHPELGRADLEFARLALGQLVNAGYSQSVSAFQRLQQAEAREIVRDLTQVIHERQEIERSRGEMLREAVHDLRGNLSAVQAAAEILDRVLDEKEDAALKNYVVDTLRRSTQSHYEMLTELLDLSRLEAGEEKLYLSQFDVSEMIGTLSRNSRPMAEKKGLELKYMGPEKLSVEGDERKTERIIQNLVLNAIKYTESGEVTVEWGMADSDRWKCCIRDTGPGVHIPRPTRAGLDRQEASTTKSSPLVDALVDATGSERKGTDRPRVQREPSSGEGVGLVIVKRLCALLEAKLEVQSSREAGTVFTVTFPRSYSH